MISDVHVLINEYCMAFHVPRRKCLGRTNNTKLEVFLTTAEKTRNAAAVVDMNHRSRAQLFIYPCIWTPGFVKLSSDDMTHVILSIIGLDSNQLF